MKEIVSFRLRVRRLVCRLRGHDWIEPRRPFPTATLNECRRCYRVLWYDYLSPTSPEKP